MNALKSGDYQSALDLANEALEIDSSSTTFRNNRGMVYEKMGRHEEAIADFNYAIHEKSFMAAYAYNNRGLSKLSLEDLEGGLLDIQHSLASDSNNAYAYKNLAIYYLKVDMKDSACFFLHYSEDKYFYDDLEEEIKQMQENNCNSL